MDSLRHFVGSSIMKQNVSGSEYTEEHSGQNYLSLALSVLMLVVSREDLI